MRPAAETMIKTFIVIDREGGRFFIVEGTETRMFPSLFLSLTRLDTTSDTVTRLLSSSMKLDGMGMMEVLLGAFYSTIKVFMMSQSQ